MQTDEMLMTRLQAGDADALDSLFRRHHARVHALCSRLSPDRASADDLVQETFIRVFRFARGFKQRSSFVTWLYTIARNVCADERKAALKRATMTIETANVIHATHATEDDARVERLHYALGRLSQPSREALVLSRWHDLPYAEIAVVLGCSEGAARVRVHRAIAELRTIMEEVEATHE